MKKFKRLKEYTKEELDRMSYSQREAIKTEEILRDSVKYGLIIFIAILLISTFFSSFTTVPTGCVGIKTRYGKVQNSVIQEGLNLKVPFIEKIVKMDCRTQKIETSSEGSTKDLQTVTINIAVNFNVNKETANELYRNVGVDYQEIIINPALLESIKSSVAQYTAEELITKRAEVSNKIEEAIIEKIGTRGFSVTEFNITNIDFSEAYDKAIEDKAVKQQQVETEKAELEKAKISNEKKVENAKAEAEVMKQQNQQITEETLRLKELENQAKLIEKWNGQLPTTALGEDSLGIFNINK